MTEKRFTLHKGLDTLNIMDNTKFNEHIYINKSSKDMELLVGVLNALHEENEQLKQQIGNLEHTKDFCAECCERLEKENEQLKSEIRNVQRDYEQLWMHTYK